MTCVHHWACGDDLVARDFPDFFATHARSELGCEWQVCKRCGEAKQVRLDYGNVMKIPVMNDLTELGDEEAPPRIKKTRDQAKEKEKMHVSSNDNGYGIGAATERAQNPNKEPESTSEPKGEPVETRVCVSCGKSKQITEFQRKYGSEERRDKCKKCGQGARARKEEDAPLEAPWPGHAHFARKLEQLAATLRPPSVSPLVKARAVKALLDANEWLTQERLAQLLDTSQTSIARYLSLLKLPVRVLAFVDEGQLTIGHAATLAGVKDGDVAVHIATEIIARGLSVRETEEMVRVQYNSLEEDMPVGDIQQVEETAPEAAQTSWAEAAVIVDAIDTALSSEEPGERKSAVTVLFDDWAALNARAETAEAQAKDLRVKYADAEGVIKQQAQLIDALSTRAAGTMKLLAAANRRARHAEIDLQMFKLQAERDDILDGDTDSLVDVA